MEKTVLGLKELLLNLLYFNSTYTIAELSGLTNKSIPSISKIVNELLEDGILIEDGLAPSTGGRRAIHYALNAKLNCYILTVAIDQHYTSVIVYDLHNKEVTPVHTIENHLDHPEEAFNNIVNLINELLTKHHLSADNILGIGVSMPGFVDNVSGTNGSFKDFQLFNIKKEFERVFAIPTFIENDSTAIAIAEQNFGKAKEISHALIINVGWGVGLGIIVDNKLFRGFSGYAGEFSHIPLSKSNKMCSCGKNGCLEVEASLSAAVEHLEERLAAGEKSVIQYEDSQNQLQKAQLLINAALSGDQLAISVLNKSAYMLGKGIATLIHIMNPQKIIISGRGAEAGKILMPQIQTAINEFCIPKISNKTVLEISDMKNAQLIGTASIVFEYSLTKFANLNKSLIK
ncbi:ROK family protein [Sphingobacterium spiritivorum]|uniref:ROK family protein n=1 Tax=Sphingobacterium spiritivorum TaxID=258 RepID=UPI003DA410E3